jgi:hypothetical protein
MGPGDVILIAIAIPTSNGAIDTPKSPRLSEERNQAI